MSNALEGKEYESIPFEPFGNEMEFPSQKPPDSEVNTLLNSFFDDIDDSAQVESLQKRTTTELWRFYKSSKIEEAMLPSPRYLILCLKAFPSHEVLKYLASCLCRRRKSWFNQFLSEDGHQLLFVLLTKQTNLFGPTFLPTGSNDPSLIIPILKCIKFFVSYQRGNLLFINMKHAIPLLIQNMNPHFPETIAEVLQILVHFISTKDYNIDSVKNAKYLIKQINDYREINFKNLAELILSSFGKSEWPLFSSIIVFLDKFYVTFKDQFKYHVFYSLLLNDSGICQAITTIDSRIVKKELPKGEEFSGSLRDLKNLYTNDLNTLKTVFSKPIVNPFSIKSVIKSFQLFFNRQDTNFQLMHSIFLQLLDISVRFSGFEQKIYPFLYNYLTLIRICYAHGIFYKNVDTIKIAMTMDRPLQFNFKPDSSPIIEQIESRYLFFDNSKLESIDIDSLLKPADDERRAILQKDETIKKLEQFIQEKENEHLSFLTQTKETMNAMTLKISDYKNQLKKANELEQIFQKTKKEISEKDQKIEQYENIITELKDEIEKLKFDNTNKTHLIYGLKGKIFDNETKVKSFDNIIRLQKEEINKHSKKVEQFDSLNLQFQQLTEKFDEISKENEELRQSLKETTNNLQKANQTITEMNSLILTQNEQLKELDEDRNIISNNRSEIQKLTQENELNKRKIVDIQMELNDYKRSVLNSNISIEKHDDINLESIDLTLEAKEKIKEIINDKNIEIDRLRLDITDCTLKMEKALHQSQDLQKEVENTKRINDDQNKQILLLERLKNENTSTINEISAQLEKFKKQEEEEISKKIKISQTMKGIPSEGYVINWEPIPEEMINETIFSNLPSLQPLDESLFGKIIKGNGEIKKEFSQSEKEILAKRFLGNNSLMGIVPIINLIAVAPTFTNEQLLLLQDMIPAWNNTEKESMISMYNNLSNSQKFLVDLSKIDLLPERISFLKFEVNFEGFYNSIMKIFDSFISSSKELINSQKIRFLLAEVLKVGNYLNNGTKLGNINGFYLSSLSEIAQNKFIVHYLVNILGDGLIDITSDFTSLKHLIIDNHINLEKLLDKIDKIKQFSIDISTKINQNPDTENFAQRFQQFFQDNNSKLNQLEEKAKEVQNIRNNIIQYLGYKSYSSISSLLHILTSFESVLKSEFQSRESYNDFIKSNTS